MGGDNYFLSMMAGAVGGFKLQKTWVNSKEKQMLTERKIKRGIKISSLKFTSVSSLCYKYELYSLK